MIIAMENDQISQYLAALERGDCYRVDATLKQSPHEVTQRVFFIGANGAERGPYIRKLIDRESGMGSAYERIFEAQESGQRFKHIPLLHECYHDENYLVVVMEFVHGETLQDAVYRRDPSLQLALDTFPLACDAVSELHGSFDPPLIHRDLKPSNIMLGGNTLTIIDFGIARAYREGAESDTVKFGTRAFAPPEQFGFGQTTLQSDIYALGMLLYYCLTEKIPTPQVRDTGFETEDVPSCLRPVLVRATALDASMRYASAEELKAAFLNAASHYSETGGSERVTNVETARVGAGQSAIESRRVKPAAAIAAFAAIAVVVALVAVFIFSPAAFNQPNQTGESASANLEPSASTTGLSPNSQTGERAEAGGQESTRTATDSPNGADGQPQADANDQPQADPAETTDDTAARTIAADTRSAAPPRNGFDPETNMTVHVGGIDFQIPLYFGQPTAGEGDIAYYYAERGTASAMIMTGEQTMGDAVDENGEPISIDSIKDGYLAGIISSNGELFAEVTSMIDCTLAGYPARIVTFNGTVKDLPLTSKMVYFYNPNTTTIGTIDMGQTSNTQFDYTEDFAKTIASAVPTP